MLINDYLYGEYTVEKWLERLLYSPVVQRLRWVALSNVPSISYPMISGVSRYAHSVGVCILADKIANKIGLDDKSRRELMISALLHDAGMPPLGHLTEEALNDIGENFDHEESLKIILINEGRRFTPMPDGEKLGVFEGLFKAEVDGKRIFEIIKGKGQLGEMIAAKVDLDNIDNIIRLYKLIFTQDVCGYKPKELAYKYFSNNDIEKHEAYSSWADIRMNLYNKLMFSIPDFCQKATIKRIIKCYLKNKMINKDISIVIDHIRFLNDAQFLNLILDTIKDTRDFIAFNSGKYDRVINYGWIKTVEKNRIIDVKNIFEREHDGYYVDYIPDKRFKYSNVAGHSKDGALIGLFNYCNKNIKLDEEKIMILHELLPELEIGVLPQLIQHDNTQLNLI